MKKEDKGRLIETIGAELQKYPYVYVVDLEGLNSVDTAKLRRACFKKEVKLIVVKNALLKKAMDSVDMDYSQMYPTLKGQTSLMLSSVNNAPAKLIKEFRAKSERPLLKSAYVEEEFYIGDEHLAELVAIKSRTEMIADIVAALMSPAQNVIGALQSAAEKKEEGTEEVAAE